MRFFALIVLLVWASAAHAEMPFPSSRLATNLMTNTSSIGGTGWTNTNVTSTTNNSAGPASTGTVATRIAGSGVAFCQTTRSATLVSGTAYTISTWIKSGTGSSVDIGTSDAVTSAFATLFNISTQAFTDHASGTGSVTGHGYYPYDNGWYRVWVTGIIGTVVVGQKPYIAPWSATIGTCPASNIMAWGIQVEAKNYPSTYVAN